MIEQNYLIVQNNVVTNNVDWNGDTSTWTPPADATMLVQANTQASIWTPTVVNGKVTDWSLTEILGAGQIGFVWNGTALTTNQPKPEITV